MRYKTVFIDWDGTLSVSRFWQHWEHEQPEAFKWIQSEFFIHETLHINSWLKGETSTEAIVEFIADKVKLSPQQVIEGLRSSCQNMQFISEEIPILVRRLQDRGVQVVIATDNMDPFSRWTVKALRLDDIFDGYLSSSEVGALKAEVAQNGHSAFFGAYLQSHNLSPQDCVLIDDSSQNRTLEKLGLNYLQIERGIGLPQALHRLISN